MCEDYLSGVLSGVSGTPTFFIDEARYDGPPDFDSLFAALDSAASNAAPRDWRKENRSEKHEGPRQGFKP